MVMGDHLMFVFTCIVKGLNTGCYHKVVRCRLLALRKETLISNVVETMNRPQGIANWNCLLLRASAPASSLSFANSGPRCNATFGPTRLVAGWRVRHEGFSPALQIARRSLRGGCQDGLHLACKGWLQSQAR